MIMAVLVRWMRVGFALVVMTGCGKRPVQQSAAPPAEVIAPLPVPPADSRPIIVAFGDSLTAGQGLRAREAYPDVLQRLLDQEHFSYRIVNAGVSGDTTTDGVQRLP